MNSDLLMRAAYAVHDLLSEADMMTRMSTKPKVILQFPDMTTMYRYHAELLRAMTPELRMVNAKPESRVGGEVVEIEIASVTFVLVCTQKLVTPSGRVFSYNEARFVEQKKPEDGK